MNKFTVGLALVCCLMIFKEIYGYVYIKELSTEVDADGNEYKFCEGKLGRFEIGQHYQYKCEACYCYNDSMECYGVGYAAGPMYIPDCKRITWDDCCYQFVREDNETIPCSKRSCY